MLFKRKPYHAAQLYLVMICLVAVASCSVLDAVKAVIPGMAKDGISVDAQIGDRSNTVSAGPRGTGDIKLKKGTVNVTTSKADSHIAKAEAVEINNTPPPWVMILLILGWVLPTPTSMFTNLRKSYVKRLHTNRDNARVRDGSPDEPELQRHTDSDEQALK